MWKQLSELFWRVVMLAQDTQKNTSDIKDLKQENRDIAAAMQRLAYELQRVNERIDRLAEREQYARENMELRLEIKRLKAERGLPPSTEDDDDKE